MTDTTTAHEAAHLADLEARKPTPGQRYTVTTRSCDGHTYEFVLSFDAMRVGVATILSLMALGGCDVTQGFTVVPVTAPTGHDH